MPHTSLSLNPHRIGVSTKVCQRGCWIRAGNVRPKKSLGQNFLANTSILQRITAAAKLAPGHVVLEVGPGTGNLTRCLLAQGASISAVEKDRRLITSLTQDFPQVNIIQADILTCDLEALLKQMTAGEFGNQRVKVIGNLPYYITQQFLEQLLPLGHLVSNAILLLQEEAALRLTQLDPGASDYRAMSVELQYYCRARRLFTVQKTEFNPVPDVNGLVVDFALYQPEDRAVANAEEFLAMVRQAFSTKRKMLRNSLQPLYDPCHIAHAMAAAEISDKVRPQQLSFESYVALYKALHY
ncbi:TPA: hypothetical protein ACH3X2_000111 [Trebouxia sp. C0005]